MKTLLASIVLVTLSACGGGSKSSTTSPAPAAGGGSDPATVASNDPSVDPTVPSWLPASCIAYHKAVVQAIDCQAVAQAKRDAIKAKFDETSVSWKAEQNGDKARVDEVGATCTTATASVRADIGDQCI